jgi:hypothetical protein
MSRQDFKDLLSKALDSPAFRRAFVEVAEQKAIRPVRSCRCVVLDRPETAHPNAFAHTAPGTVTAFVAREGDPLLQKLTEAIEANDSQEFNSAIEQIKKMAAKFARQIAESGVDTESRPRAIPSLTEITYAGKSLTSDVHVDDVLRVHVHAFPYNGGYLNKNNFSMAEYYPAGSDTPLICVLLIRQPQLSDIEKEALRLVPSASSANNIGAALVAPITPALTAFIAAAVEAAARWVHDEFVNWFVCILAGDKGIIASIPDAMLAREDFRHKLKSLPPEVTAAELLRLRTEILFQQPPE